MKQLPGCNTIPFAEDCDIEQDETQGGVEVDDFKISFEIIVNETC